MTGTDSLMVALLCRPVWIPGWGQPSLLGQQPNQVCLSNPNNGTTIPLSSWVRNHRFITTQMDLALLDYFLVVLK